MRILSEKKYRELLPKPENKVSEESKKSLSTDQILMRFVEEASFEIFGTLDAFLFSCGSSKTLARNIHLHNMQRYSRFQSMEKSGYIQKINDDQFLITPKAVRKIRMLKIEQSNWAGDGWDGSWRIVSFDIPESKRYERDIFRSLIKRKGFIGIQKSTFISPFADLKQLAFMRKDLGIEKYVSFFMAKSYETDDDTRLKKRFDLK